jgi:hypothetical protein
VIDQRYEEQKADHPDRQTNQTAGQIDQPNIESRAVQLSMNDPFVLTLLVRRRGGRGKHGRRSCSGGHGRLRAE